MFEMVYSGGVPAHMFGFVLPMDVFCLRSTSTQSIKQNFEAAFADGVHRCVVMVGLPYPNPQDPELLRRMAFMDAAAASSAAACASGRTTSPGQQYYQDLCMKVVF